MARQTKIFGAKLRAARERRCLTQSELGAALDGMSDENIGRIERSDVAGIMTKHLPKLAEALGMTLDSLRGVLVAPDSAKPAPRLTLTGDPAQFILDFAKARGITPQAAAEMIVEAGRLHVPRLTEEDQGTRERQGDEPPGQSRNADPVSELRDPPKTKAGKRERRAARRRIAGTR